MYAGHTQVCRMVLSPSGCLALAKTEAAVQRFSYLVILLLIVPIAIYLAVDLLVYAWQLLAKADFSEILSPLFWNRSMSILSVDLPKLLRTRFIVSDKIWNIPSVETFYRIKTVIEVVVFLMLISMPLNEAYPSEKSRSRSSSSDGKRGRHKRARQSQKGLSNEIPLAGKTVSKTSILSSSSNAMTESSNARLNQENLAHSDVCPLCGMSKDNSSFNSKSILKGSAFITLHPLSGAPDFWNGFRMLWSRLLHRSMRALEGLSVVKAIKQNGVLNPRGIGRGSLFGNGVVQATSRLAKRKILRLLEHSQ